MAAVGTAYEDVRDYVQSFYNNPTNNLTYLLLVGDAEQVPTNIKDYGDDGDGGTDPMYGLLAGSDKYPEVIVGRFSGSTEADINTMVTRVINYEKTPATNGIWYTKACGIASDEGDGVPAWLEYIADTQPTNPESCFALSGISRTNQSMQVRFSSSSGRKYTLRFTDCLTGTGVWQTVADESGILGKDGTSIMSDSQDTTNRFYRVDVSVP